MLAQEPLCQGVQTLPAPGQYLQQRRLLPLCWQNAGVQARALAEGSSSSKTALPARPIACRITNSPVLRAISRDANGTVSQFAH
jgi:hypothetical protein